VISVPSMHVVQSFTERGVDAARMFCNPYGVDLDLFPATEAPDADLPPRILMVGTWSFQKGCDVLLDAWRRITGTHLLHVGTVGDLPLPVDPGFVHHGPVDQKRLTRFYALGHVFALASRQEGLACVQAQALASGLHVVCTDRTGGEDLRRLVGGTGVINVVPSGDVQAFAEALNDALEKTRAAAGLRDVLGGARTKLTWRAYAERYSRALEAVV
jgi:glycosyltransferase involved in cell wall biosynthesis